MDLTRHRPSAVSAQLDEPLNTCSDSGTTYGSAPSSPTSWPTLTVSSPRRCSHSLMPCSVCRCRNPGSRTCGSTATLPSKPPLRRLGTGEAALDHSTFDELPGRTTEYLRGCSSTRPPPWSGPLTRSVRELVARLAIKIDDPGPIHSVHRPSPHYGTFWCPWCGPGAIVLIAGDLPVVADSRCRAAGEVDDGGLTEGVVDQPLTPPLVRSVPGAGPDRWVGANSPLQRVAIDLGGESRRESRVCSAPRERVRRRFDGSTFLCRPVTPAAPACVFGCRCPSPGGL